MIKYNACIPISERRATGRTLAEALSAPLDNLF